jgi:hypothetical protein
MFQYDPQAVIVRYQVRGGAEAEFEKISEEGWRTYLQLGLIHDKPHVLLRGKDESGAAYYLELMPWKDRALTGNPPPEVRTIWGKLEAVCEARSGHRGIEIPPFEVMWNAAR